MSTAAPVPTTRDLEGDDAVRAVRDVGLLRLFERSFARLRYADGFSHARALAFQSTLALIPALITLVALAKVLNQQTVTRVLTDTTGLATTLAFMLVVFGAEIGDALESATAWGQELRATWAIARWPVGAALAAIAVALLFKVAPHRRQPSAAWLILGSTLAVVLWLALTGCLALYVEAIQGFGQTYGPLAGMIGLMLWMFVGALALFFGLGVAAQLEAERAGLPAPGVEVGREHAPELFNPRRAEKPEPLSPRG